MKKTIYKCKDCGKLLTENEYCCDDNYEDIELDIEVVYDVYKSGIGHFECHGVKGFDMNKIIDVQDIKVNPKEYQEFVKSKLYNEISSEFIKNYEL